MFSLTITNEIKSYLREIRKELRARNYKESKSKHNTTIGAIRINNSIEYFIKGKIVFEIEQDKINNELRVLYYNDKKMKEIMLSDILTLA